MNQDSVFVYDPKSTSTDTVLLKYIQFCCGIIDGHGSRGGTISEAIREKTVKYLAEEINPSTIDIKGSLVKVIKRIDKELLEDHMIDCYCSGASLMIVYIKDDTLYYACLGDWYNIYIQ